MPTCPEPFANPIGDPPHWEETSLYLTSWEEVDLIALSKHAGANSAPHWKGILHAVNHELERRAGGAWTPSWNDAPSEQVPLEPEPLRLPTARAYDHPAALSGAIQHLWRLERDWFDQKSGETLQGILDHLLLQLSVMADQRYYQARSPDRSP